MNNSKVGGPLSSSRSSSSSPTPNSLDHQAHPHWQGGGGGCRAAGESALLGQARGVLADMLALLNNEEQQQLQLQRLNNNDNNNIDNNDDNKSREKKRLSLVQRLTSGLVALNDLLEPLFVGRERCIHNHHPSSTTHHIPSPDHHDNPVHGSLSSMSNPSSVVAPYGGNYKISYLRHRMPPDHGGGGGRGVLVDSSSRLSQQQLHEPEISSSYDDDDCYPYPSLIIPGDRPPIPCYDCATPLLLLPPFKQSLSMRKSLPPAIARRVSSAGGLWSTTTSATGMPTLEPTPLPPPPTLPPPPPSLCAAPNTLRTPRKSQMAGYNTHPPAPLVIEERGQDKDDDSGISTDTPTTTNPARRLLPPLPPSSPHPPDKPDPNGEVGREGEQHNASDPSATGIIRAGQCISSQSKSSPSSHSSHVATTRQQPQPPHHHPPPPSSTNPHPNDSRTSGESANHDSGTDTAFLPPSQHHPDAKASRKNSKPRTPNPSKETKERCDNSTPHIPPSLVEERIVTVYDGTIYDLGAMETDDILSQINSWEFPIFEFAAKAGHTILSQIAYRIFHESNLFQTFDIPVKNFLNFFHALEDGYRENPYHNRIHAADVLQAVYYLTTQPVPGFREISLYGPELNTSSQPSPESPPSFSSSPEARRERVKVVAEEREEGGEEEYGVTGHNLTPLELMALYTAAAMHDYDHPGRTNAFLVTISAPQAILYNDRSVLENHHAAASWKLYLSHPRFQFLAHLPASEFKRFRFLVIEAILATDLKRHFEILAEFNAKISEEAGGVDWFSESDRLLVLQMCIKIADINGPCKPECLHLEWTKRITEEFYLQGDEEASLGLEISPYMDKRFPQVSKLQESFITHLVAPLSNSFAAAGMLPGYWEFVFEEIAFQMGSSGIQQNKESRDNDSVEEKAEQGSGGVACCSEGGKKRCACSPLTTYLRQNHLYWNTVIKGEDAERSARLAMKKKISSRSLPPPEHDTHCDRNSPSTRPVDSTNTTNYSKDCGVGGSSI